MRLRELALAILTAVVSSSAASAATIHGSFDVRADGTTSAPVQAAPGDTVIVDIYADPGSLSISGWNLLFSWTVDLSFVSLVGIGGTQQSADPVGRRFSYNNALTDDQRQRGPTATVTMTVGPLAMTMIDFLHLDQGSSITLGLDEGFDDVLQSPGPVIEVVVPEPTVGAFLAFGLAGFAVSRARRE